ncbi:MAG: prephenate dehydrogenase/arogenate dehydrogenase family protein [Candidatus Gracilibacteria bacterium]|nr:prephenate dehydrogenase/arogenate dehydrogenase family protein [Candidatus Gracilibacteria bacterium]
MQQFKIVIIGGTSLFGQFWKKYFEEKGQEVIITSRNTKLTSKEAVKMGDIIIFSVSIRHTVEVIKELIPEIPVSKLIMDFTGIKNEATAELKKYTSGEVVATHPMFGPWIKSLQNQNIAFDPVSPGEKWDFIYNIWKEDGANLIEMSSKRHDEIVGIIQSSVHFINLLIGHILKKKGIHPDELVKISTPNSRMQLFILSRFLNQEASLYTDMQMCNSTYKNEIVPEILDYAQMLFSIIGQNDSERFENEFNDLKQFIGQDFPDKALTISSKFDEELKKVL